MKNIQHSTAEARPATNIQRPSMVHAGAHWMLDVPKGILTLAIRAYQLTVSPILGLLVGPMGGCRYTPTCSAYAMEAVREHGAVRGSVLAAKRICRCHPWGGCGHDPVPQKSPKSEVRNPKPNVGSPKFI